MLINVWLLICQGRIHMRAHPIPTTHRSNHATRYPEWFCHSAGTHRLCTAFTALHCPLSHPDDQEITPLARRRACVPTCAYIGCTKKQTHILTWNAHNNIHFHRADARTLAPDPDPDPDRFTPTLFYYHQQLYWFIMQPLPAGGGYYRRSSVMSVSPCSLASFLLRKAQNN